MAAKKMKKQKMPANELFRPVETIVEKGTGIKKGVKKIEGLPHSAGAMAAVRATVALAQVNRP